MSGPSSSAEAMDRLLDLMARLRAPDGCPWDREQTPATLKPQMLEECYEVLEAIDSGSPEHLTEELGDLLLHVVFQAQIAREAGDFTFADVATGIADKLVRRHPHIFRRQESGRCGGRGGAVASIEEGGETGTRKARSTACRCVLPALMRAEASSKEGARRVGFDWPDVRGALDKVREEVAEFTKEIESESRSTCPRQRRGKLLPRLTATTAEEIGDLLFSIVNPDPSSPARRRGTPHRQPTTNLRPPLPRGGRACIKAQGKTMTDCTLEEPRRCLECRDRVAADRPGRISPGWLKSYRTSSIFSPS